MVVMRLAAVWWLIGEWGVVVGGWVWCCQPSADGCVDWRILLGGELRRWFNRTRTRTTPWPSGGNPDSPI